MKRLKVMVVGMIVGCLAACGADDGPSTSMTTTTSAVIATRAFRETRVRRHAADDSVYFRVRESIDSNAAVAPPIKNLAPSTPGAAAAKPPAPRAADDALAAPVGEGGFAAVPLDSVSGFAPNKLDVARGFGPPRLDPASSFTAAPLDTGFRGPDAPAGR